MQDLGGRKRHRVELEKAEGDKSGGWRDSRVHALASQIIEEKRRSSAMRKARLEREEAQAQGNHAARQQSTIQEESSSSEGDD